MKDWLTLAKQLRCGATTRTLCADHCGDRVSQLVSHTDAGYRRHCFRCGASEFIPHGVRTLSQLEQATRDKKLLDSWRATRLHIPRDVTYDMPRPAVLWLLKYGIGEDLMRRYGIQWSEEYQRVVLPVFEGGVLTALQMRSVNPAIKPKYLNPRGPSIDAALFRSNPPLGSRRLVITEDILSCIKVGTVNDAVSILGTNLTDARLGKIASVTTRVLLWLDSDAAGVQASRTAYAKLKLLGLDTKIVDARVNTCDPKTYSRDKIQEIIEYYD